MKPLEYWQQKRILKKLIMVHHNHEETFPQLAVQYMLKESTHNFSCITIFKEIYSFCLISNQIFSKKLHKYLKN